MLRSKCEISFYYNSPWYSKGDQKSLCTGLKNIWEFMALYLNQKSNGCTPFRAFGGLYLNWKLGNRNFNKYLFKHLRWAGILARPPDLQAFTRAVFIPVAFWESLLDGFTVQYNAHYRHKRQRPFKLRGLNNYG